MTDQKDTEDRYHILAESGLVDDRTLVLMCGDTFGVFDRHGDVLGSRNSSHGLFHQGTRFLSRLMLTLSERRPLLLSSGIREDNERILVHLTNPDVRDGDRLLLARDSLHVLRQISLEPAGCVVSLSLRNYAAEALPCDLSLRVSADFADIFEVRGAQRAQRGVLSPTRAEEDGLTFGYEGLDKTTRTTHVSTSVPASKLDASALHYELELPPGGEWELVVRVTCAIEDQPAEPTSLPTLSRRHLPTSPERPAWRAEVRASSQSFETWLRRSRADLQMLTASTPAGAYPYAGVPWFATPFGRDGIIAALESLWLEPDLARGVLKFLAVHQSDADRPASDAEPGKIIHEMRAGEMAALGEVPFAAYYGSVDATPLFLMLAAAYYERTADDETIASLWPHLESALGWLDGPGDPDKDGFIEYARRSGDGLLQQGWKDSRDSVMHADGSLATGPIALCEVQAYAYAARRGIARLATHFGHHALSESLDRAADALRKRFDTAFWCEELGTYALALDGAKQRCAVRSSNAGHVLLTDLALPGRAKTLAETLLSQDHFSGWGIRTLSASASRYNPMSYHNGSVWPHDNALIASGFSRHGQKAAATTILAALFDASRLMEHTRLPELFCGFPRTDGEGPTRYPVACSPQAWSAGAAFLLVQAALGLSIDAVRRQLRFDQPSLPSFLDELTIRQLRVRDAEIDLMLERHGDDVDVRVLRRTGPIEVVLAS